MSINDINLNIRRIKSEGYTYPTMTQIFAVSYSPLIFPLEHSRHGEIRTYKEVCERSQRLKVVPISEDSYYTIYNDLLKALEGNLSYEDFMNKKRLEYILSIFDSGVDV